MPSVITWDTNAAWSDWINEDVIDPTEIRIVGDYMKIPFSETSPPYLTTELARWRFGANQNFSEPLDNTASSQHGAQISENGLLLPTRNSHVVVNEASNFNQPVGGEEHFFLSCWFKSSTTDYSSGIGIIAGYTSGVGTDQIQYAIGVNTSNQIKGFAIHSVGGAVVEIPVAHGDVLIDTNWHSAIFAFANASAFLDAGPADAVLYLDNNTTLNQEVSGVAFLGDAPGAQFSIGSSELDDANGFAGVVDEVHCYNQTTWEGNPAEVPPVGIPSSFRFTANVFLSPVLDTEKTDSILSGILAEFEIPNGSMVTFSFRASNNSFDQDATNVTWTNFTAPSQVTSGVEADVSDLGVFVEGRYQQVRVRMTPSDSTSSSPDPLQLDTPVLQSLRMNVSRPVSLLTTAVPAYNPGTVLQQIATFSGDKTIHKVSLCLSVTSRERRTIIVGKAGTASFQAANFQDSRDDWIFQPVVQNEWESSGTTITNTYQQHTYASSPDAVVNAPFLHYDVFFPEGGSYDLWGYGYTGGDGLFWAFDSDTTHLRRCVLGSGDSGWIGTPRWTKFGNVYLEEGGTHGFTVYLGDLKSIILDQWYFTTSTKLESTLGEYGNAGFELPLPLSKSPFNTAVRLRSLDNGAIYDLDNPPSGATSITAWGTSKDKAASGSFNYAVREDRGDTGVIFSDGLLIEYWQIGGDRDNFAAWDFRFN